MLYFCSFNAHFLGFCESHYLFVCWLFVFLA